MSEVTVRQLAADIGVSLDRLLVQLDGAGLRVGDADDVLNDEEKLKLLGYLRKAHGRENNVLSVPKKVTLKRRSLSELKQARSPGQATKSVSVEVRKRRTYVKRSEVATPSEQQLEMEAAKKALEEQQKLIEAQEAERRQKEEELKNKRAEEAAKREEEERKRQEEVSRKAEGITRREGKEAAPGVEPEARTPADLKVKRREQERPKEKAEEVAPKAAKEPFREQLHVPEGKKRKRKRIKGTKPVELERKHVFEKPTAPVVREVTIPESITVSDLSQKMSVKAAEVIKVLMRLGIMANINQMLDQETASLLVEEMGHQAKLQDEEDFEAGILAGIKTEEEEMQLRAPIITIMGHVDHGKTSLLDFIRKTRVAAGEAGGITQHIGAYRVKTDHGSITFLDTPGHAAFTAMRARGAQATDIVVVVVAADDGVMPQTKEAIEHSRAADVPIIVAVNKIDKPDAEPERVKQELVALEVVPEEWGGDTLFVNLSAKTGEGVDALLEALLLQAEILELRAPANGAASGVVIESKLDRGRGPVATVLVQKGLLKKGDIILCGEEYGRVRALFNENSKSVKEADPSTPVEVLGLSGTPAAGEDFLVIPSERQARELALHREEKQRSSKLAAQQAAKLEEVFSRMEEGKVTELSLIIKADVQGSLEALRESLTGMSTDEVRVKVISGGVGGINEGDANLALASNAIIIGFNVRADASARKLIEEKGIDLHYYSVIYDVIGEVEQSISGMLAPEIKEEIVGIAEVRNVFRSPKFGAVAGCMVTEGTVARNLPIRVLRDNVVVYEGQLESLRRFKDDVAEVKAGMECGIAVKNYNDVKVGDQIEVFERVEVKRTL